MTKEKIVSLVLRASLAFAFLYAAISASITPDSWIGYFPRFIQGTVSGHVLISGWGVFEAILALWILSGKKIFIPSVIATLALLGLILTNLPLIDVLFRDVSILGIAIALAIQSYKQN